jgi:hypothetical protein
MKMANGAIKAQRLRLLMHLGWFQEADWLKGLGEHISDLGEVHWSNGKWIPMRTEWEFANGLR